MQCNAQVWEQAHERLSVQDDDGWLIRLFSFFHCDYLIMFCFFYLCFSCVYTHSMRYARCCA
jgi:hypothetical protein